MSKFKKNGGKEMQAISTASLPDIVFMLLFFFMVTTTMKETDMLLEVNPPSATEIRKMEDKSLYNHIYIGLPAEWQENLIDELTQKKYGTAPRVQLGGTDYASESITTKGDDLNPIMQKFIEDFRASKHEDERPKLITSIKVDKKATMGAVTAVKNELRKNNALKICYLTEEDAN